MLPLVSHHSFAPSLSLWLLPYFSLSLTWRPRRSLHSLCTGQAPWVSHHGNPFTPIMSCELQPLFFSNPPLSQKKKRKVLNYSRKHSLQKNDWTGTQVKRLPVVFSFSFPLWSSSPSLPLAPLVLISPAFRRDSCVSLALADLQKRERERRKKNSFKRAWADSAGELWHRLSLCICVYVCVSGAVWVLR